MEQHTKWSLPTRSATDRKVAGIAGGLGRAWRVDPVLIRVAFVVLTIFGGSGIVLYCIGWMAMRGDGDEVSALESLIGRGRSAVSPGLTIALILVALTGLWSSFAIFAGVTLGFPFWPVLVGVVILFALRQRNRSAETPRTDLGERAAQWGREFGDRAAQWGRDLGERIESAVGARCSSQTVQEQGPAAQPGDASPAADPQGGGDGSDMPTSPDLTGEAAGAPPEPEELLRGDRTPPAWDPLGAAPFAWDLPEPTAPAEAAAKERPATKPGSIVARITLGLALIVGAVLSAAAIGGQLRLSWGAIGGVTLGVLAAGMFVGALLGRGARTLIGPGIFVAVLTLALTVTGLTGTHGFGDQVWAPTSAADVAPSYYWNAGDATLDLRGVAIPAGATVSTEVRVGAGQVTVVVPPDATVEGRCLATAGSIDCLGIRADGLRPEAAATQEGTASGEGGTFDITVISNAGQAVLISNE